ncbi:MAG: 50S ribosomal protein L10 [Bacteroidota bacterium]|nr:50S ribosomal protein L10 [Bacteroidota bacterium]
MKREEKDAIIGNIVEQIKISNHFYLTDIEGLNAEDTSMLRRQCFKNGIKLVVVKNTLLNKALEKSKVEYKELYDVLKGPTAVMFTEQGNTPGKLIKEFRKKSEKPVLKAAYIEETIYVGDEMLDTLASMKSREEMIGDIVLLLQSPTKKVITSLQSGANILHGVLETLAKKDN